MRLFHQTVHLNEVEAELARVAARWNIPSCHDCCRLALFMASVSHSKVISTNHLVDIFLQYCLVFLLYDLLFDAPDDDLLEGYGIHRSERESMDRVQACLNRLTGIFCQALLPVNICKNNFYPMNHEQHMWVSSWMGYTLYLAMV